MTTLTIQNTAKICHEANRAYCEAIGDFSQKPWNECEEWQRESAMKGVVWRLANPGAPSSAQHDAWLTDKFANDWKYGPIKDAAKKEHPCCIAYGELPLEQQIKDALFTSIVESLRPAMLPF